MRLNISNTPRLISLTTSDLSLFVSTPSESPQSSIVTIATIRVILLLLSQPGAPYFDETNVSKFFNDWSDICVDYEIREDEKVRRFPKYISDSVSNYVKTLQEYEDRKWKPLRIIIIILQI